MCCIVYIFCIYLQCGSTILIKQQDKMKKANFLLAGAFMLSATAAIAASDNNFEKEEISNGEVINSLEVVKMVEVRVFKVDSPDQAKVVLYAEDGDFENFEYEISDNKLEIGYTKKYLDSRKGLSNNVFGDESEKYVEVYTTEFDNLEAKSMGSIIVKDSFSVNSLDIEVGSMGDVELKNKISVKNDVCLDAGSQSDIEISEMIINGGVEIGVGSMGDIEIDFLTVYGDIEIGSGSMGDFSAEEIKAMGNYIKLSANSMGDIDIEELITYDSSVRVIVNKSSMGDVDYRRVVK